MYTGYWPVRGVVRMNARRTCMHMYVLQGVSCSSGLKASHTRNVSFAELNMLCDDRAYGARLHLHHPASRRPRPFSAIARFRYPGDGGPQGAVFTRRPYPGQVVVRVTADVTKSGGLAVAVWPAVDSSATVRGWAQLGAGSHKARLFAGARQMDASPKFVELQQDRTTVDGDFRTAMRVQRLLASVTPLPIVIVADFLDERSPFWLRVRVAAKTAGGIAACELFAKDARPNATMSGVSLSWLPSSRPQDGFLLVASTTAHGRRVDMSVKVRAAARATGLEVGVERVPAGWLVYYGGKPLFISPIVDDRQRPHGL